MLQCISVLTSLQPLSAEEMKTVGRDDGDDEPEAVARKKLERLRKELMLNWLGRGRTGRNRRGLVGTKLRTSPIVGVAA